MYAYPMSGCLILIVALTAGAEEKPLRVAAVQMRSTRNLEENLRTIEDHLAKCAAKKVRVAVFPECAATGYFDDVYMKGFTAEQLKDIEQKISASCKKIGIYGVMGMPTREGDKLYNSAVVIDPMGKVVVRYHKIQLAERWPVGGEQMVVFKVDEVPCSVIVCHDERYPELVRLPVLAGAKVIFYVSHESPVQQEKKLNPYRAQIQARAVENTVYVVHANAPANKDATGSHGQSRLIAPDGNLLDEATMFGEEVLIGELDLKQATRRLAQLSVQRGPLGDWWREGVKKVRVLE